MARGSSSLIYTCDRRLWYTVSGVQWLDRPRIDGYGIILSLRIRIVLDTLYCWQTAPALHVLSTSGINGRTTKLIGPRTDAHAKGAVRALHGLRYCMSIGHVDSIGFNANCLHRVADSARPT